MSRPSGSGRRRLLWVAVLLLGIVLGAAGAVVLREEGNVSNPEVEFEAEPVPTTPPTTRVAPSRDPFADRFEWPMYGYSKARTKYLPVAEPLRPPFVETWKVTGRILLEFPPVLCGRQLFLLKNNGALYGISRRTGRVRWKRKLGYLAAASPTCSHGEVYAGILERDPRVGRPDGRRAGERRQHALVAQAGQPHGELAAAGPRPPVLRHGGRDGLRACAPATAPCDGPTRPSGAVKGALALSHGKLFFGDYAGQVTALRRADGRRLWRSGTSGAGLGLSSGNFYATPAVAYGRVYLGNTDGFVYSFSARTGDLAWRHKTGGYVYSSPAVSPARGGTVYAGSYDGKLYAFNARTGDVRWTRDVGGRISGGPQVVGDLVFYSNLGRRSTGAVGAANGKLIWSTGRGAFNPAISDGRRIYLVGYSSLFALTTPAQARRDRRAARGESASEAPPQRPQPRAKPKAKPKPKPKPPRVAVARNPNHLRRWHGHRHRGSGDPPRCHRHRHRTADGVYTHTHCHRHLPRRR